MFYELDAFDIDDNNINSLTDESYPDITSIYWTYKVIDKKILEKFPNLETLDISNNLTTLEDLPLINSLKILCCHFNKLSSLNMPPFPNLEYLYCEENPIKTLKGMPSLPKLKYFFCAAIEISSLEDMPYLPELKYLHCHASEYIKTLKFSHVLPKLKYIDYSFTNIPKYDFIKSIPYLPNLEYVDTRKLGMCDTNLNKDDISTYHRDAIENIKNILYRKINDSVLKSNYVKYISITVIKAYEPIIVNILNEIGSITSSSDNKEEHTVTIIFIPNSYTNNN